MVGVEAGRFRTTVPIVVKPAEYVQKTSLTCPAPAVIAYGHFFLSGKIKLIPQGRHRPRRAELIEWVEHGETLVSIELSWAQHLDGWPAAIAVHLARIQQCTLF